MDQRHPGSTAAGGRLVRQLRAHRSCLLHSWDYARSYTIGKRRYHHIIDPRTGYPATASRSVTVWADDATTADAIDDAVFILGPEKGLALVEKSPGVGVVIVDKNNKVWISERLKGKVHVLHPPTDAP